MSALQALGAAFDLLVRTVKAIASVAKEVAKAAGNALLKIPDVIGSFLTVLKILPWIALGVGGYYVAVKTEVLPAKYDPLKLRERETCAKPRQGPSRPSISTRSHGRHTARQESWTERAHPH